jgi:hypothetical protein
MGDVTVRVTTTLDQGAGDESIGYGQMNFQYQFDDGTPREWPETSPAVYDPSENPTANWQNDCGATQKQCSGFPYYGGHGECAQGHEFWRTYLKSEMRPETNKLVFTGRIWTIDSWDGEQFTVTMMD